MGICCGKSNNCVADLAHCSKQLAFGEFRKSTIRSAKIDQDINEESKRLKNTIKLLLLGPSEVGKSTIVKQLRLQHCKDISRGESLVDKYNIYLALVRSVIVQAEAFMVSDENTEHAELRNELKAVQTAYHADLKDDIYEMKPWLVDAMQRIIKEPEFARFLADCGRTNPDAPSYFLENIDRVCAGNYTPSSEDFLNLRMATSGLVEFTFFCNGFHFRVIDVGGQTTERKKWLHAFEGVKAVIFLCALSDFNLTLREDGCTNRLKDAISLFQEMYCCVWLKDASFIIFFNKKDLLEQKLAMTSLRDFFEDYRGDNLYENAAEFLETKFLSAAKEIAPERTLFSHRTCAVDSNQMQLVLDSCMHMILEHNLKKVGIF